MARKPYFAWTPGVLSDSVDRVTTLLDPRTASVYELNEVGAMVWQECRKPSDAATVASQLKKAFPKQPLATLRSEAEAFIDQLANAGLLSRVAE